MALKEKKRWRCVDCGEIFLEVDMLTAPNPFGGDEEITGCPECKSTDNFGEICDEESCQYEAVMGFPDKTPEGERLYGGYRRTCSEHGRGFST